MDGIQFADGFDTPDRLAFGLGAPQLITVVGGCLLAFAVLHAPVPGVITIPIAVLIALSAALLGWARIAGRSALEWALFAARHALRPREGTLRVIHADPRRDALGGALSTRGHRLQTYAPSPPPAGEAALASKIVRLPQSRARRQVSAPRVLRGATARTGARRVVFFSLKGGTGRTTLATEVAVWLAAAGHGDTALIDCDLRAASVGCRLGLTQRGIVDYALADPDERRLDEYMAQDGRALRVLLGPPQPTNPSWPVTPAVLREVFRELDLVGTRTVVVDVCAELTDVTRAVLRAADDVLVVVVPTSSGIQDAYRTTEQLRKLGLRERLGYVVNHARHAVDVSIAMNDLGGEVIAEIPEDAALIDAENVHRPAVLGPTGPAALELRRLAGSIVPARHALAR